MGTERSNGETSKERASSHTDPNTSKITLLCMRDSEYTGLFIESRNSTNLQIKNPDGDDKNTLNPFIHIFPHLGWDVKDFQEILEDNIGPEEITKKLVGKKADFKVLMETRKYRLFENIEGSVNRSFPSLPGNTEGGALLTLPSYSPSVYNSNAFQQNPYPTFPSELSYPNTNDRLSPATFSKVEIKLIHHSSKFSMK